MSPAKRQGPSPTIRRFFRASLGFGIGMGLVFPFYALAFARFPNGLALGLFSAGCVAAGLIVGLLSYLIGKKLILEWIDRRSRELGELGGSTGPIDLRKSDESFFRRAYDEVQLA